LPVEAGNMGGKRFLFFAHIFIRGNATWMTSSKFWMADRKSSLKSEAHCFSDAFPIDMKRPLNHNRMKSSFRGIRRTMDRIVKKKGIKPLTMKQVEKMVHDVGVR
jgi:hypothetical protein